MRATWPASLYMHACMPSSPGDGLLSVGNAAGLFASPVVVLLCRFSGDGVREARLGPGRQETGLGKAATARRDVMRFHRLSVQLRPSCPREDLCGPCSLLLALRPCPARWRRRASRRRVRAMPCASLRPWSWISVSSDLDPRAVRCRPEIYWNGLVALQCAGRIVASCVAGSWIR